ncbi:Acyl-CoA reductase (LuxC) [compost metagenome]
MREAAVRLAADIGAINQKGCVCARVVYVQSGTDEQGLEKLNTFGQYVYDAMIGLPNTLSTTPKRYDQGLKAHVDALRLDDEWYKVIGGKEGEGAIICSQLPEPVSFSASLDDRTANLVPVDDLSEMMAAVDAYTQTVGVYPENIKDQLKDVLPLYGAQRIVSLGYAAAMKFAAPQDSIEPMRRMGKWISNQIAAPQTCAAPWLRPSI